MMTASSLRFNRFYDFARIRFGQMLNEVRFPSRRTENRFRTWYVCTTPMGDGLAKFSDQIIKNQSSSIGLLELD